MVANIDETGKAHGFKILSHCKSPAGDRRLLLNEKSIQTLTRINKLNEACNTPIDLDDYIFLRKKKNNLLNCTPRSFNPQLHRYCHDTDMEIIKSPHDIRRTVLINLHELGMPLKMIQVYARQSSLQQTLEYIHTSDNNIDMMQYLNALSTNDECTIVPFESFSSRYLELNTIKQS